MIRRINYLAILLLCFSFTLINKGIINSASAEQKNTNEEERIASNKIYGKVTDIIDVAGYTYAEVDTGTKKVWAAGPTAPLSIGDMITFSTRMPMENFYSKSLKRDFPIIYFINHFDSDTETSTTKDASITTQHAQVNRDQVAKPIKGINKIDGGNTIAEIYTEKHNLNGKVIRVRGQIIKFTAEIMGKNWLHIRDSSTLDDLTVTTDSVGAINDIVIVEGKLELDKDYGYGYVYPVILENANMIKD